MNARHLPACCAVLALACSSASALDLTPSGLSVQIGRSPDKTNVLAVGAVWDSRWRAGQRVAFSAYGEVMLSHWRADAIGGGHQSLQQLTLLPVLRIQPRAESPFFFDIGIGASYLGTDYATSDKRFSTRWNFYDVLGAGYRFGPSGKHEIGLRLVHVSNAGLRHPNPGEEFVMLRYATRF